MYLLYFIKSKQKLSKGGKIFLIYRGTKLNLKRSIFFEKTCSHF